MRILDLLIFSTATAKNWINRGAPLPKQRSSNWVRRVANIAAISICLIGLAPAAAEDNPPAMVVSGQFNVNATGGFTYTIPIAVPPGTGGMVPPLSLNYSSQSGDGTLGLGWALTGLPAISHCHMTLSDDGYTGGVNYNANDRLCIDGQRLVLASGTWGADGSHYRSQIDSFSDIIAHGSAGIGPAWFEVHTKTGQILEFGNTTDSRVLATGKATARAWAVDKISDTAGNYITITYNCAASGGACTDTDRVQNGSAYPIRIDYTGNAGASLSPYNSIQFTYTARNSNAIIPRYQGGSIEKTTKLLTDIKTYAGANVASDYKLAYTMAINGMQHDELTSVTECDGTTPTPNCLKPTTFGWQGTRDTLTYSWIANSLAQFGFQPTISSGDFNGDGITDAVASLYQHTACPPGGSIFYGSLSGTSFSSSGMGSDYLSPNSYDCDGPADFYFGFLPAIVDTNGDGLSDVIVLDRSINLTSYLLQNNKSLPSPTLIQANLAGSTLYNMSFMGDFNGDGRADWFQQYEGGGDPNARIYQSDGSGAFYLAVGLVGLSDTSQAWFTPGDFDGDGCTDGLVQHNPNEIIFACPLGHTVTVPFLNTSTTGMTVGDFNGDGKSDLLIYPLNGGTASIYLSTGTGFIATPYAGPNYVWKNYAVVTGDWNGDGKTDIAVIGAGSYLLHDIYLSTGTGFSFKVELSHPTSDTVTASAADWNSDGATDLWFQQDTGDHELLFNFTPEYITTVDNGLGSKITVTYDRLNKNGTLYTKATDGTYPIQDVDGSTYVVSRVDASNGLGACTPPSMTNCYSSTYSYAGGKTDLRGRGFLGFSSVKVTDVQTGIVQTTTYRTDFPYVGLIASQTKVGCGGVTLNSLMNTFSSTSSTGGGIPWYFVYLTQSVTATKDCDGTVMPTVTTAYSNYDTYGNVGTIAITSSDGSSKTTTNTYSNDATHWLLGRLLTANVQSIVGASNLTRHTSYTYDSTTGLITSEIIEPSLGTNDPLRLETDYTYDTFGNKTSAAVKGCVWSGAACTQQTRTTTTAFDAATYHGAFPTSVTNALSQSESRVYSTNFGQLTSQTGPNGLTSTWSYDTFSRMTLQVGPDGNKTAYSYTYCTGLPSGESCPTNAQFDLIATPQTSGGAQNGPIVVTYYDSLSRVIAQDTQGFDGSWIRVATQYDANGRVAQGSRPYFLASGTPKWAVNTYDTIGRVTQATFPDGGYTSTAYHGLSVSVTKHVLRPSLSALDETTTTAKNAQGQVASVTDANSKVTTYVYDAFDDLLTVTDPSSNVTTNTYDLRGRKLTLSDPDMGNWSYVYDGYGELYKQTDAKSQVTTLTYDALGRPLTRTEPGQTSTWTFDMATKGVGKLATATTGSNYLRTSAYDSLGRPLTTMQGIDGTNYSYTTTYNNDGRIATVTYPSGLVAKYLYNAYGYLCRVTDNAGTPTCTAAGGATVFWTANARDAELHLTLATAGNNIAMTQVFDPNTGLVQQIRAGTSDSVANFSYTFDSIGDLYARSDMLTSVSESFGYDILNRLTSYQVNANPAKSVAYDYLGNITSKSDVGTYTYGSGAGPHAVTSITGTVNGVVNPTYAYDANGNMTSGAGRTITYTSFNMAAAITQGSNTLALSYDSEHARYKQVATGAGAGATLYLNDPTSGAMAEKFTSGANTTWHDYIMADGHIVTEKFSGATTATNYFVLDNLGSVAVITDNSGTVIERLSYDAWGKRRNSDGSDNTTCSITSSTTRGFTGHEEMDSVCLVNANARVYDPTIGRFMSADSIIGDQNNLQSWNRYSYVLNNPLSLTDPTGNCVGVIGCGFAFATFGLSEFIMEPLLHAVPVLGDLFIIAAGAYCGPCAAGVAAGVAGAEGGHTAEVLKAGVITYVTQVAMYEAGQYVDGLEKIGEATNHAAGLTLAQGETLRVVLHGFVGGISSVTSGGKFGSGFLAGGFGALADQIPSTDDFIGDLAIHATAGGVGSVIGGGKFGNGAVTGAFGYLFNYCAAHPCNKQGIEDEVSQCKGSFACYRQSVLDMEETGLTKQPDMGRTMGEFGAIGAGGGAACAATGCVAAAGAAASKAGLAARVGGRIIDLLVRIWHQEPYPEYQSPPVEQGPPPIAETWTPPKSDLPKGIELKPPLK